MIEAETNEGEVDNGTVERIESLNSYSLAAVVAVIVFVFEKQFFSISLYYITDIHNIRITKCVTCPNYCFRKLT